jgi:hypothetical protein
LVLYEICSKFKGINRTGEKPNDWWQASLTGKPLGETRREWRKFKSETIGPAIIEINSLTDIHLTLEENKAAQYALSSRLTRNLNIIIGTIFTTISYSIAHPTFPKFFVPMELGLVFGVIILHFYQSSNKK